MSSYGSIISLDDSAATAADETTRAGAALTLRLLKEQLEARLPELLDGGGFTPPNLMGAMKHALLGGGKRFRPLFFLCMVADSDKLARAIDIGCAIEMVHTASLILDDLPCMDDAHLRRQQPTTHVVFGQATAILAAISLLSRGFNIISTLDGVPGELRAKLVSLLTNAVGPAGLAAGQELDLSSHPTGSSLQEVEQKNWLKTGILFATIAEMAALYDGKPELQSLALTDFAFHVGSAFQAFDDYLDATGDAASLGKDAGKDQAKGSFVAALGEARTRHAYHDHLERADVVLSRCGINEAAVRIMLQNVFRSGMVQVVPA